MVPLAGEFVLPADAASSGARPVPTYPPLISLGEVPAGSSVLPVPPLVVEPSSPIEEDVLSTAGSMVPLAGEFVLPADAASSGARPVPTYPPLISLGEVPAGSSVLPEIVGEALSTE
jgi:hypothetical protein